MGDLIDFLNRCLADDEARLREMQGSLDDFALGDGAYFGVRRLTAEVQAKRELIKALAGTWTVRLIALPYADRPGFREEWRP